MVEVLGPSCHKRENFPPEIDVYKVPHSRLRNIIATFYDILETIGQEALQMQILLNCSCHADFFQDEGTCHFCGTDFATDWGELIGKISDDNLLPMGFILYEKYSMKAVLHGFGRAPSILKIYFLESPIPAPAPPRLSVTKSITWRYLGNQAWYHRSAGVKTTRKGSE